MRKIADKIEYSPTTIYLYFEDKADLLDSLARKPSLDLLNTLELLNRDKSDPVETLRKKWKNLCRIRSKISARLQADVCRSSPIPEGFRSGRRNGWREGV